jgi:hypothetical protein
MTEDDREMMAALLIMIAYFAGLIVGVVLFMGFLSLVF